MRLPYLLLLGFIFIISYPSCKCNQQNSNPANDSIIAPYLNDPVIKSLTEKIRGDAKNPELYFQRAVAFRQMQKTLPAYTDIKHAIELDSTRSKYWFLQSEIMLSDGYAEGAIRSLNKIIELEPENKEARKRLAKTYLYAGDNTNSLAQVNHLIEKDKTDFEPYFIAGLNYKDLKDTATAIQHFRNALQYRPDFYEAYMQLGLLTSNKKSAEAQQYFDNALRLDSTSEEAYYAKGKFFQDHKQYEKAKKVYRKLISISPQHDDAFFNMGFIYLLQDSSEKAHKHFDFVLRVKPNHADAYYYRALSLYQLGDNKASKDDLARCLALDPENELAQNLLNEINKQATQ